MVAYSRYSLVLLRTHADEGDGAVREMQGGKERGTGRRYHKTLQGQIHTVVEKHKHGRCSWKWQ